MPASKPADTVITLNVPEAGNSAGRSGRRYRATGRLGARLQRRRLFLCSRDVGYRQGRSRSKDLATAVQPFQQLLGDFQAKFHVEPDISVRLIEPTQCEVTNFLRFMGTSAADRPQLELDRTSVPNGSPIGGTLVTRGGLMSSVLLIDHKGMAFNLDDRVVAQADKATFSIPIGLGAADKAAGKARAADHMVITGPRDVQGSGVFHAGAGLGAAAQILDEIGAEGCGFSATAKYFRLGG